MVFNAKGKGRINRSNNRPPDELLKMEGMQDTFTMLILSKMTKE